MSRAETTRILYCGTGWFPVVEALRQRLPKHATLRLRDQSRPLRDQVGEVEVLLPSNALIDREVIKHADALRLIQQPAAGYENIDLDTAQQRGVAVCVAPGANSQSVAEAALLLLLGLARRLPAARKAFEARRIGEPEGIELAGKTLGIVGLGGSGTRLAAAAGGLGMRVLGVRSSSSRAELEQLLAQSDFISLHCPLTEQTRGLLGPKEFGLIKPGAFLVNCARGGIVDRAALTQALEQGRLGGVGLDVYWQEPWDPNDPLFQRENVVTLPHLAGATREAFGRIADIVVENVRRLRAGESLLYRVA